MKFLKYLVVTAIIFASCKGSGSPEAKDVEQENGKTPDEELVEPVGAVCVYEGLWVRDLPNSKPGKAVSQLSLGESIVYLGKSETDTIKKREYHYVQLSDGQKVWAPGFGVVLNAKPGAMSYKSALYNRPDLITKSKKALDIMSVVAIKESKDDWYEVVSYRKRKSGWVPKKKVTTKSEDVAIATLVFKSVTNDDGTLKMDELASFIDELPLENSYFKQYLQKKLDESVEAAIEENLMQSQEETEAEPQSAEDLIN